MIARLGRELLPGLVFFVDIRSLRLVPALTYPQKVLLQRTIGNDIVDLSSPEITLKSSQTRYTERALTSPEIQELRRRNADPAFFWRIWAAKEAAYKALNKDRPEEPFIPLQFEVLFDPSGMPIKARNSVGLPEVDLIVDLGATWVHCIAICQGETPPSDDRMLWRVERLKEESASNQVRGCARHLLADLGWEGASIGRPERKDMRLAPEIRFNGTRDPRWDVSLSHDGAWVAAAVLQYGFKKVEP